MKEKVEMEVTPGGDSIRFKQTSKGIWYCDGLCIYCQDAFESVEAAEKVISRISTMLKGANKVQKKNIQKKIQV